MFCKRPTASREKERLVAKLRDTGGAFKDQTRFLLDDKDRDDSELVNDEFRKIVCKFIDAACYQTEGISASSYGSH